MDYKKRVFFCLVIGLLFTSIFWSCGKYTKDCIDYVVLQRNELSRLLNQEKQINGRMECEVVILLLSLSFNYLLISKIKNCYESKIESLSFLFLFRIDGQTSIDHLDGRLV